MLKSNNLKYITFNFSLVIFILNPFVDLCLTTHIFPMIYHVII